MIYFYIQPVRLPSKFSTRTALPHAALCSPEPSFSTKTNFSLKMAGAAYLFWIKTMTQAEPEIESPYREVLAGILSFSSLSEAEETLGRLESLRRKYRSANDRKGEEYCRSIALLGRRRAEQISRNKRVRIQKRREKREIAIWFGIWLETPEIFENWLILRKKTGEFQELQKAET